MKKLFFSALAIVAFSLTSFANEIENQNLVEPVKEVATSKLTNTTKDDFCVEVEIRWDTYETYYDNEFGMEGISMQGHKISFTICL
jgi:hypothetical protein